MVRALQATLVDDTWELVPCPKLAVTVAYSIPACLVQVLRHGEFVGFRTTLAQGCVLHVSRRSRRLTLSADTFGVYEQLRIMSVRVHWITCTSLAGMHVSRLVQHPVNPVTSARPAVGRKPSLQTRPHRDKPKHKRAQIAAVQVVAVSQQRADVVLQPRQLPGTMLQLQLHSMPDGLVPCVTSASPCASRPLATLQSPQIDELVDVSFRLTTKFAPRFDVSLK